MNTNKLHNIFQPILQVDGAMNTKIDVYEMLMRDAAEAFPGVGFLNSLTTLEGNEWWIAISKTALINALEGHSERKIYINLEPCQMEFESVWQFLTDLYNQYGSQVAIEITERRANIHSLDYLDDEILRLRKIGFKLTIDDVCAGSNSYAFVVRQLGAIKRIKLSLLVFKNEDDETKKSFVNAWLTFAKKHHLDFVIEGIANEQLAKAFAGQPNIFQQGFYWGKGTAEIQ